MSMLGAVHTLYFLLPQQELNRFLAVRVGTMAMDATGDSGGVDASRLG